MDLQKIYDVARKIGYVPCVESYVRIGDEAFLLAKSGAEKMLMIFGQLPAGFSGKQMSASSEEFFLCPLSHVNAAALKKICPWLKPISANGKEKSFGTGDRLGLLTGAHIAAFAETNVFPILAQQSIRELTLTGRTNQSMMEDVMWQIFEAGYKGGYGADGDHLKEVDDIKRAIREGSTFITLDCSEYVPSRSKLDEIHLDILEREYCHSNFHLAGVKLSFDRKVLKKILSEYQDAVRHICTVYENAISSCKHDLSFEISLDEASAATSAEAHFFIANELKKKGVFLYSIAPKFCGEFQKGIDYIGTPEEFQENLRMHARIAEYFGYKISIHSGSDKFKILKYIGSECHGKFHLKTSGTSWVESVRVIAMRDPVFFRKMLRLACQRFGDAQKYYHVSARVESLPDIDLIRAEKLPDLMDRPDVRQIIHITYGAFLNPGNDSKNLVFRKKIYDILTENKDVVDKIVAGHIKKHIEKIDEGTKKK
ncbi:MAG TPA: tagaturonate epimerase family protein [Firmicutes bacterium]|nr:tagaturonate epimerase family protein [Bacillota bacterium]